MAEYLSRRTKIGFGIGDLGGNMFFTIIGFYLLFYLTDIVRLPAALAGTVLMIGKIWDAITDPVTGFLSDRTVTRWGRRRPYIFAGAIATFFSMAILFSTPQIESSGGLFTVMAVLFCLVSLAYTLVNIPYAALVPELTSDFDQRTELTGYRMTFAVIGTLIGAGAVLPVIGLFENQRTGWLAMGGIMGFIMMATALITVASVREPKRTEPERAAGGFFKTCIDVLGMRVFLKALIPWMMFIGGTSVIQGSLIYYFRNVYKDEGLFQLALIALLVTALVFIPIWVMISKRIGKKRSYIIGMVIVSVGVLLISFFGGEGRVVFAFVVMVGAGVGLSTHYVMPHSILPDVVEYDAVHNGVRREGIFSSMWTFASKVGQALALLVTGIVLDLVKYEPDVVAEPITITGIRLLCGPIPVVFYAVGIVILLGYPITREYYQRMLSGAAAEGAS